MNTISRRALLAASTFAGLSAWAPAWAAATGTKPAPLAQPVKLSMGILKVAHLAPLAYLPKELKALNVELETAEFVRYADARTAVGSESVEIAAVGPPDLPILLSQGLTNVVALLGVGTQPKHPLVRKDVKLEKWSDFSGKKVAIAPGSTVWFQFAAMLEEVGVPYSSIQPINIQGGGSNFHIALKRGDADVAILWEPFESQAVIEGYAYFAESLDYSKSKAVGADLGVVMATKKALERKRDAMSRLIWAYAKVQADVASSKDRFAKAIVQYTGVTPEVAEKIAGLIHLKPELSIDQMKRQAAAFYKFGVIQKDVSGELENYYPEAFVASSLRGA
jgi:sulfonate transport system substrate-binding protein